MLSLNDALFKIPSRHLFLFFMMVAKAFAISIKNTVLETYACYTSILFFINNLFQSKGINHWETGVSFYFIPVKSRYLKY